MNLYTDIDASCCRYLERLVALGRIPPGEVRQADIREVRPGDLAGYVQCHFFCGIGGWPLALGLAGWPAGRACWTASLPCQPFSSAGKRLAERDERHLWPAFRGLVAECRPPVLFGEQVASKPGRRWLAGVRLDLESLGYAVGAADLPAACVGEAGFAAAWGWRDAADPEGEVCWDSPVDVIAGAPHRRQRLWWVADADGGGRQDRRDKGGRPMRDASDENLRPAIEKLRPHGGLADATAMGRGTGRRVARDEEGARSGRRQPRMGGTTGGLADADGGQPGDRPVQRRGQHRQQSQNGGPPGGPGDAGGTGLPPSERQALPGSRRRKEGRAVVQPGRSFWADFDVVACRDGKARRIEPGTFPLAHGVSGRVAALRGYGNAIVPQVAAEFVRAYTETVA